MPRWRFRLSTSSCGDGRTRDSIGVLLEPVWIRKPDGLAAETYIRFSCALDHLRAGRFGDQLGLRQVSDQRLQVRGAALLTGGVEPGNQLGKRQEARWLLDGHGLRAVRGFHPD